MELCNRICHGFGIQQCGFFLVYKGISVSLETTLALILLNELICLCSLSIQAAVSVPRAHCILRIQHGECAAESNNIIQDVLNKFVCVCV